MVSKRAYRANLPMSAPSSITAPMGTRPLGEGRAAACEGEGAGEGPGEASGRPWAMSGAEGSGGA